MSCRLVCLFTFAFLAAEVLAQPASLRPLPAEPRLEHSAGEVAWTLTFEETNTPGVASGVVIAAAPDRGVCTLSSESFGPGRGGTVLARYTEAGVLDWEQVASTTTLSGLQLLDVTAVNGECVGVFIVQTGPRTQYLRIVRAGAKGLDWSYEMNGEFFLSASALIEADGEGGVWVGFGSGTFVDEEGERPYILRLDTEGEVVQLLSFEPPGNTLRPGVRDLAALPDGRAVAVTDLHLLLLLSSKTDSAPFSTIDAEYVDEGQALDVDSAGDAVYLMGYRAPSQLSVQRLDLRADTDGLSASRSWESLDIEGGAYLSPHLIDARDGSLYVLANGTAIAQLDASTGTVQWTSSLPDEMRFCDPRGLLADSEGVVVDVDCGTVWRAAFDENGSQRWRRNTGRSVALLSQSQRSVVPCGEEGVCMAGTRYGASAQVEVDARAPDEEQRWEIVRQGDPAAFYAFERIAPAPGGGLYVLGASSDETGRITPLVMEVGEDGDIRWGSAIEDVPLYSGLPNALDVAPDGDLVVGGKLDSFDSFAMRFAPTGELKWSTPRFGSIGAVSPTGLVATDDGGALLLTTYSERNRLTVIRVGTAGDTEELLELSAPQEVEVVPYSLDRVPGGYVASAWNVSDCFSGCEFTFVAYWFDESGALLRTDVIEGIESFEIAPAPTPRRTTDTQGNLYVTADLRGSLGFVLLRIETDGMVALRYLDQREGRSLRATDIRDDGHAVLLHRKDEVYHLTRVSDEGDILWEVDPLPEEAAVSEVAAGPQEGALVSGGRLLEPALTAYQPGPAAQATTLPRIADLSTEANTLTLTPEGLAYVSLRAQTYGSVLAGIARVNDAFSVNNESIQPQPDVPLIITHGPNPIRGGGTLRLTLGARVSLALYDLLGRRVAAWTDVPPGDFAAPLPATLPAGLYVLRAESEDASTTARVTVVR